MYQKGTGKKTVILNQNNLTFTGVDINRYIETIISYPNDCSKNGICKNGQCICKNPYSGYDCKVGFNGETIQEYNLENNWKVNDTKNGSSFKLDYGSLKFTISIKNYQYKNNLNTLRLQLISSVEQLNNQKMNVMN
ncbi:hypothetical protein ACTFIW_006966 [Dictyostelium discoideum]